MRRLRPLSEIECYARCYGTRDEMVRVIHVEPRAPRRDELTGERLRLLFEQRMDARVDTDSEAA